MNPITYLWLNVGVNRKFFAQGNLSTNSNCLGGDKETEKKGICRYHGHGSREEHNGSIIIYNMMTTSNASNSSQ